MIEINVNSILTLENNKRYIVVAKAIYNETYYDYLLELSPENEKITNKIAIVKEEIKNNEISIVAVKDQNELHSVIPLLKQQLENL